MGERDFSFRILVNEEFVDFEAEKFNQKPYILSFFPSGNGETSDNSFVLDNKNIILSALKDEGNGILIRLYNSSSKKQNVNMKFASNVYSVALMPFEVKTFINNKEKIIETDMMGE